MIAIMADFNHSQWRSGGGQQPYYTCGHKNCDRKPRNAADNALSRTLTRGDHLCCETARHSIDHEYAKRDQAEAAARPRRSQPTSQPPMGLLDTVLAILKRSRQR